MIIRFNQRSQQLREDVQPRPTLAEKVRRILSNKIMQLSNLLTSPNLPRPPAHMHPRIYACACASVCVFLLRQVRRLDSEMIINSFFRLTFRPAFSRNESEVWYE